MTDDKRGASGPPGGKRRRPPPTIDVKATEIASEPVKPTEPVDPPAETPQTAPQPAAASVAAEPPPPPREPPSPNAPPPRSSGWRPEWLDVAAVNERLSALRSRASGRLDWRVIAAGMAGAGAMLVLFLVFWVFGVLGARDDVTVRLAARLAFLESQLREIAGKPQPAGLDQRALADLAARVGATEQAMGRVTEFDARIARAEASAAAPRAAQIDQALTARVVALETATRPLAELRQGVEAASAAARDARERADAAREAAQKVPAPPPAPQVAHSEIDALSARIAALEQSAKTIDERIARATAASAGADKPARLAFAAVALRAAVERGQPFVQELAAAKALAADAKALAPLEPFTTQGVPTAAALARELKDIAPSVQPVPQVARDVGLVGRLQQNAERLVRVRPINETAGDEPSAVIARAEAKAAQGDIAGALAEVKLLPDPAGGSAAAWIGKAQLQIAALGAARQFTTAAVDALKAGP